MNRSPHQSRDHEPAGVGCAPKHSLCGQARAPKPAGPPTTLPITPAPWGFHRPYKQYNAMVGAETASTAGTSLWDSTAPDGTRATNVAPSPNPRCLPGWSRALPTLQEWGSTVVATTHLACALSLSRCLTPSDCAHMACTCLFVIWTSATCTAYHASPVSPVSLGIVLSPHMQVVFALFWCLLGQVLPLVSDRILGFSSALVASHLSLKKASRALITAQ